jgi:hypothetical protein
MSSYTFQFLREQAYIHNQVSDDWKIAKRFQANNPTTSEVEGWRNTRETLASLNAHPATPAGGVMTGMPEHQRGVLPPGSFKGIEDIRLFGNTYPEFLPVAPDRLAWPGTGSSPDLER